MNFDRKLETIRIFNDALLVVIVATSVFACFQILPLQAAFLGSLPLVLFLLASEIIEGRIQNLIVFLGLHAIAAAATLYGSYLYEIKRLSGQAFGGVSSVKILLALRTLAVIIVLLLAIYSRIDGKGRFYPEIGECFVFIALFALCTITGQKQVVPSVIAFEIIWAVLCIIFYNLKQTAGALVTWKNKELVPYESIGQNNRVMVGISIVVSLFFIGLSLFFDYGKEILMAIKRALQILFRWIFSHFYFESEAEYEVPETEPASGGFGSFLPNDGPDDSIWHTIWNVLFWIVGAVVTVFIIYLIILGIREFYRLFNSKGLRIKGKRARDEIENLSPLQTKEKAYKNRPKKLGLRERLSPSGRVRRMFVRYIEKGMAGSRNIGPSDSDSIRTSDTPRQMEEKVALERDHRKTAYEIYEKARYSTLEITSKDVENMKNSVEISSIKR